MTPLTQDVATYGPRDVPDDPPRHDGESPDDIPDTPPTEPQPVPIEEPPPAPQTRGPYIV